MSRPRPIALAGLSPTEQLLIEGVLFQPAGNQIPGAFMVQDMAQAELIIASADDAAAVRTLRTRALPGRVLLVGASDLGTGWPVVARPMRLHAVMEAARRMLASPRGASAAADEARPVASPGSRSRRLDSAPPGFDATQPAGLLDAVDTAGFETTHPAGMPFENTWPLASGHGASDDMASAQQFSHSVPSVVPSGWEDEVAEWEEVQAARAAGSLPAPAAATPAPRAPTDHPAGGGTDAGPASPEAGARILIVGQPGAAADGLIKTLHSDGFQADFAEGGDAALQFLAQRPYGFVILIEVSLGPAAIPLCRTIRGHRGVSSAEQRIVIVASHNELPSRIRAWLAGCHAWMPIPLNQVVLVEFLKQHDRDMPVRA